jgi:hypothetical protein
VTEQDREEAVLDREEVEGPVREALVSAVQDRAGNASARLAE